MSSKRKVTDMRGTISHTEVTEVLTIKRKILRLEMLRRMYVLLTMQTQTRATMKVHMRKNVINK